MTTTGKKKKQKSQKQQSRNYINYGFAVFGS